MGLSIPHVEGNGYPANGATRSVADGTAAKVSTPHMKHIPSNPEQDLQGFCFQDSLIALSSHFSWQVEYGRHESGNLVTLFLELTVVCTVPQTTVRNS